MSRKAAALVVDDLHKSYGDVDAIRGLSFTIPRGTVLGLLGSNGAGKTTTVRVVSTLLPFDRGTVEVLGRDVVHEARAVRAEIGLTGQYAALDEHLTAHENLEMIGRLHRLRAGDARRRAIDLLENFDLIGVAERQVKTYSGGMRRRLDLAASLIVEPALLILDEPTTGLDPASRRMVRKLVRDLVAAGTSVLLTTQYLDEADELSDDIVVMEHGAVLAHGTPEMLKKQVGGTRIEAHLTGDHPVAAAREVLAREVLERFGTGPARLSADRRVVTVPATKEPRLLARVVRTLDDLGIAIDDVRLREPTLDDVFLTLTSAQPTGASADSRAGRGPL
ncbi:ATP-binding cassette domain-containing protein [Brachybacterium sp. FME24]|uniref:ATP-binding cassette domain-containing protein n=1 Tax=Brachybacterium sp. FME24 TaxID=2742605 RepID=UPI001867A955|nr:ATP-binding cassette domain-containing protein [Brachybacterium sp. FME24]